VLDRQEIPDRRRRRRPELAERRLPHIADRDAKRCTESAAVRIDAALFVAARARSAGARRPGAFLRICCPLQPDSRRYRSSSSPPSSWRPAARPSRRMAPSTRGPPSRYGTPGDFLAEPVELRGRRCSASSRRS
jgi:hypothetical protein